MSNLMIKVPGEDIEYVSAYRLQSKKNETIKDISRELMVYRRTHDILWIFDCIYIFTCSTGSGHIPSHWEICATEKQTKEKNKGPDFWQ